MSEFREAARELNNDIISLQCRAVCPELKPIAITLNKISLYAQIKKLGREKIEELKNFRADKGSKNTAEIGAKIEEFAKEYESDLTALANRQNPSQQPCSTR